MGEQQVVFQTGRDTFGHSFLVCKLPTSADGIIGLNFVTQMQTRLHLDSASLRVCLKQIWNLLHHHSKKLSGGV